MTHWKLFIICFIGFIVFDFIWLGLITKNLYHREYAPWLRFSGDGLAPVLWAALIVYVVLSLSMVVFVFPLSQNLVSTLLYSAVMGLIIYGVYDFTCIAIFKDWPVFMSVIDWIWGGVLCSLVGGLGYVFKSQGWV